MSLPIQTPVVGQLLQRAFGIKGRVRPALDEIIVPVVNVADLFMLLAAWGVFMSLRHSALHLARDIGQGLAAPILGVHTYVWSWVVHWAVLLAIGALFFFLREDAPESWPRVPSA